MKIAGQCEGVRSDMTRLVLPDVFERTGGGRAPVFWPDATRRVRERAPGFTFMAEVYWDLEWTMLQQGFDYAYDKRPYDRLGGGHAPPARSRGRLRGRNARGRGDHHLSVSRPALLPPGATRGAPPAHHAAPDPR